MALVNLSLSHKGRTSPGSLSRPGPTTDIGSIVTLVKILAARSIKVRYRGSALGVFWSLSNPLLMTAVYTAIFGTAFASSYGGSIAHYMLAVFVALAVLAFFASTTSQALTSIVANGGLLNKVALPPSAFPVSTVVANTFQLAVGSLPLLLIVTLITTKSVVNAFALLGPLLGLVLLALGCALALSALYVYFRDLPYVWEVFTFIIYMTTPIFYPASLVPPSVRVYLRINPVALDAESLRHIALSPSFSAADFFAPLGVGLIAVTLGYIMFQRCRRDVMDLL